jgi:diguanylate cyclase (GGDEF)-like protein
MGVNIKNSVMKKRQSKKGKETATKLFDIESKNRFNSQSLGALGDHPELLKKYLEYSIHNTFSELMFRLTHEVYTEKKATLLWDHIVLHRETLKKQLNRDVGMLVSALDYLSNITGEIANPKIMDDLRIEEAAAMAMRDSLTGLYLRGVFDFSLERLIKEHQRYKKSISLLMLDIDDFKKVNDTFGHQAGDNVLRTIGKIILSRIRKADFPARYGGEELAVILPETSSDSAVLLAEKLRLHISKHFVEGETPVTVSIGVSSASESDSTTATQLIRQADKALYTAKRAGKNKIEKYASESKIAVELL